MQQPMKPDQVLAALDAPLKRAAAAKVDVGSNE